MAGVYIVDIPLDDQSNLQFESTGDLHTWVTAERRLWLQLSGTAENRFNGHCRKWWQEQISFMAILEHLSSNAVAAGIRNATEIEAVVQKLKMMGRQHASRYVCSAVPGDIFIKTCLDSDPDAAVAGLILRRGTDVMQLSSDIDRNVLPNVRDAQLRFQIALNESIGSDHRKKLDETLKQIESERRTESAMGGLIGHWINRSKNAMATAMVFLGLLIIAATLISYGAYSAAIIAWDRLLEFRAQQIQLATTSDVTSTILAAAPFIVLTAVPIVWVFRHLSRLFIENLSDARDARLRATMAEAYVAMMQNKEMKPTEKERAVILAALFRAGSSQSADEGVPLPLIELLKTK